MFGCAPQTISLYVNPQMAWTELAEELVVEDQQAIHARMRVAASSVPAKACCGPSMQAGKSHFNLLLLPLPLDLLSLLSRHT
eukprot:scaffold249938_cov19-Tisochrysis_lutea.AAC.2